jgi:geranylgeranylglycerol-phosphate geranylgeranyltransferase
MLKMKSALSIARPINFLIILLAVVIAGLIGSPGKTISYNLVLAALSFAFASACGNVFNDIIDLESDKINKPERVLVSGLLNLVEAKFLVIFFGLLSILLSIFVSVELILLIIGIIVLVFLYSLYFQNIILVGNIVVSLMTASALLGGGLVVNNIKSALIPAGFAFITNLIREIIKDIEDLKGDKTVGVITLPLKYGVYKSLRLLKIIIACLLAVTLLPYFFEIYSLFYLLIILICVHSIYIYILFELLKESNSINFFRVSKLIKASMLFGLIAIYIGAL